jgi:hypothetical protein
MDDQALAAGKIDAEMALALGLTSRNNHVAEILATGVGMIN